MPHPPRAYCNECDPAAAAWTRELIDLGLIAPGIVDERSIVDVQPSDLAGFTQCHFFAGIACWSYALRLAGWPDDRPVWTGSCPCPSFSVAGRGDGFRDPRHLWPAWFRLIRECRPELIFGEQVAAAIGHGWLDLVCTDLEGEGYAIGQAVLGAHSVGAPHIRQRLWFVADPSQRGQRADRGASGATGHTDLGVSLGSMGDSSRAGLSQRVGDGGVQPGALGAPARQTPERGSDTGRHTFWSDCIWIPCRDGKSRPVGPGITPLVDGSTRRMGRGGAVRVGDAGEAEAGQGHSEEGGNGGGDVNASAEARVMRLRAYGNAIVAPLAAEFIAAYMDAEGGV